MKYALRGDVRRFCANSAPSGGVWRDARDAGNSRHVSLGAPPQTKRYAIQAGRHELPQATAANYGGRANTGEYPSQGRPMVARLPGVIPPVK